MSRTVADALRDTLRELERKSYEALRYRRALNHIAQLAREPAPLPHARLAEVRVVALRGLAPDPHGEPGPTQGGGP